MHFHVPKPLHGWREFAGEVGIIVVGVLIALAAEQVVEGFHWRRVVASERDALHEAIQAETEEPAGRLVQEVCIRRRLGELLTVFQRHAQQQPLGMLGGIGVPGVVGSATGAWQTAGGGEVLDHMRLDERLDLGGSFAAFAVMRESLASEAHAWDELQRLDHPEILEDGDWVQIRAAYADALAWDDRNVFYARWLIDHEAGGRMPTSVSLAQLQVKGSVRTLCEPLLRK
jgi:hypothetical protein